MNDQSNYFFQDQNFFIPNEDIFTAFLNSTDNKKPFEPMVESIDEIFKIDSNLNIFANFLNEDNDLKKENNANNFNVPHQKQALSKSAFTKMETKDTFKSTYKMDLNLVNNSDSNSTNNSKEDYTNSVNTGYGNDLNNVINNSGSKNNINNFNNVNSNTTNTNNNFNNINLKNHSTFNNNIFPNLTTNSFNNVKEGSKLFGVSENYNNSSNNFSKNLFSDKYYNFKGIFNKEKNSEQSKDSKPTEDFLNKKTQRENVQLTKETDNSILGESNLTTYSNKNNKSIEVLDGSNNKNVLNKTIFKTIKNHKKQSIKFHGKAAILEKEITSTVDMKKMMKLMKNRLSARKCRQKKKHYIRNLEKEIQDLRDELNKFKSIQTNEMKLEYYIDQLHEKETEIKSKINKKKPDENSISEYTQTQQNLLTELFRRILRSIVPIDFKIFSSKCIKIQEIEKDDTLETMVNKIRDNHEILKEIYDFNTTGSVPFDSYAKNNNNIPLKMLGFFHYLKKFSKKFLKNVLGKNY